MNKKTLCQLAYFVIVISSNSIKDANARINTSLLNKNSLSYILKINFPQTVKIIPDICSYFKGYKINFDRDLCVINQPTHINQFILVITPQVNHKSEGNNIKYLERIENQPCRVFYLTNNVDNTINSNWSILEEDIDNLPLRLPDESLVILMNPNYLDSLKNKVDNENNINNIVINLPELIIKQTITQEELTTASIYALLASFDSNAIHTPVKKISKKEKDVIASVKLLER